MAGMETAVALIADLIFCVHCSVFYFETISKKK